MHKIGLHILARASINISELDFKQVQDQVDKVEFSGPLLSQTQTVEELLEKHERQIRQAVRQSWFQRGLKVHQMFAT